MFLTLIDIQMWIDCIIIVTCPGFKAAKIAINHHIHEIYIIYKKTWAAHHVGLIANWSSHSGLLF